jgi:hypothetical protein
MRIIGSSAISDMLCSVSGPALGVLAEFFTSAAE